MKIANIDRENLHIFWTKWGISMKFSGNMWLMIILKVTKNPEFHSLFRRKILKKPHDPPSRFWVKSIINWGGGVNKWS